MMHEDESEYTPLSIDNEDYDGAGEEMKSVNSGGFVSQNRGQHFWLQTGRMLKGAATTLTLWILKSLRLGLQHQPTRLSFTSTAFPLNISILANKPINIWDSVDSLHRCHQIDVPDIPTRAFRDNQGLVRMIQGSTEYHNMTGSSLFTVHRDCAIAYNKTANPDPSFYAANEWIDSPIVFDNGTVVALVHTEFPGDRYNQCDGPHYPYCWMCSIGLMVSHDFGNSWQHAREPPHHLIAAVPYQYSQKQLAYGWGDPTNILKHPTDGYYYFAAWNRNRVGLQSAGVCMMRTNNLMDPASWRGWNGKEYAVQFANPYTSTAKEDFVPADHVCTVLEMDTLDPTKNNAYGLVYSKPLDRFLITWGPNSDGHGHFSLSTSEDLIHWTTPQPFFDLEMLDDDTKRNVTSIHYPNLMDATAPEQFGDNSYGIVGEYPYLFWVSIGHSPYTDGRSAWATPLHITKNGAMELS